MEAGQSRARFEAAFYFAGKTAEQAHHRNQNSCDSKRGSRIYCERGFTVGHSCGRYPLQRSEMESLLREKGKVAATAARWTALTDAIVEPSLGFPSTVRYRRLLEPTLVGVDDVARGKINEIVHALTTLLGGKGLETNRYKRRIPIARPLLLVDQHSNKRTIIMPGSVQKRPQFELWHLRYLPSGTADRWHEVAPPYVAVANVIAGTASVLGLATELVATGPGPYTYHFVAVDDVCPAESPPGAIHVTAEGEPVDLQKLRAENRQQAFYT
jgi:hypothetical protein